MKIRIFWRFFVIKINGAEPAPRGRVFPPKPRGARAANLRLGPSGLAAPRKTPGETGKNSSVAPVPGGRGGRGGMGRTGSGGAAAAPGARDESAAACRPRCPPSPRDSGRVLRAVMVRTSQWGASSRGLRPIGGRGGRGQRGRRHRPPARILSAGRARPFCGGERRERDRHRHRGRGGESGSDTGIAAGIGIGERHRGRRRRLTGERRLRRRGLRRWAQRSRSLRAASAAPAASARSPLSPRPAPAGPKRGHDVAARQVSPGRSSPAAPPGRPRAGQAALRPCGFLLYFPLFPPLLTWHGHLHQPLISHRSPPAAPRPLSHI